MPIPTGTRTHSAARTPAHTRGSRTPRSQLPAAHGRRGRAVGWRVTAGPRGLTVPPAGCRPPIAGRDVPLAPRVFRGAEHKPFTPSCNTPRCVIDINKHSPTLQLI